MTFFLLSFNVAFHQKTFHLSWYQWGKANIPQSQIKYSYRRSVLCTRGALSAETDSMNFGTLKMPAPQGSPGIQQRGAAGTRPSHNYGLFRTHEFTFDSYKFTDTTPLSSKLIFQ